MRELKKLHWPYKISLPKIVGVNEIDPRTEWGIKQFTKQNFKAIGYNPVTFFFRNRQDYIYFSLMWAE